MDQMKIIKIEKPMLKYFLIFKVLLLSSISVYGMDSTSAVQKDSISTEKSILLIQDQKTVYPGKPLLMSLVLPGAGQYYNKAPAWKTALFFGMELASILAWNNFKNKAESIRKEYQNFADENWSLENWVYNRFNPVSPEWGSIPALSSLTGTHDLRLVVSGDLANDLNISGHISSDSLEKHPEWFYSGDVTAVRDRHFYENIGKYDQFVGGWGDARDGWYEFEKNVGDSTEMVIKTPYKEDYIEDRYRSNQMLNYAKYSITALMFNHVISGIESVWFSQKKATEQLNNASNSYSKINLVFNPINPFGIGGFKMSYYF